MATTKAQRKLFFNIRKMAQKLGRLGWFSESEIKIVAKELKVKPEDVVSMEMRLNNRNIAFDSAVNDDEETNWSDPVNYLEAPNSDPAQCVENEDWTAIQGHDLSSALSTLDERSKNIIEERWLKSKKATLQELAVKYNVSAERIRQLEENAMLKLKKGILNN